MHLLQQKLLKISEGTDLTRMSLREIGRLIEEDHPQKVQHHLMQLEKKGLIKFDRGKGIIQRVKKGMIKNTDLVAVPIFGSANCGPATLLAEENLEGYLKISRRILNTAKGVFAIKALGNSMNRANIRGNSIEEGDYIIIDGAIDNPRNGDYVLSIIDDVANIKRFVFDTDQNQIILVSESTEDIAPIFIHPDDKYVMNGRVIQVIKKPKLSLR